MVVKSNSLLQEIVVGVDMGVSGVVVRGHLVGDGGRPAIRVSEREVPGTGSLATGERLYAMAISTPYGCVVALGVEILVEGQRYAVMTLLDPLDPSGTGLLRRAVEERAIDLCVGERVVDTYRLSDEDVDKVLYTLEKTRECDIMRGATVDLDKAFEWILTSLFF